MELALRAEAPLRVGIDAIPSRYEQTCPDSRATQPPFGESNTNLNGSFRVHLREHRAILYDRERMLIGWGDPVTRTFLEWRGFGE